MVLYETCQNITWQRWGQPSAGLLHTDFMHLAGSLLPWAVLYFLLEVNYGSIRVFLLCLVSLLGSAFTSAVLDPPCQVVRSLADLPRSLMPEAGRGEKHTACLSIALLKK